MEYVVDIWFLRVGFKRGVYWYYIDDYVFIVSLNFRF